MVAGPENLSQFGILSEKAGVTRSIYGRLSGYCCSLQAGTLPGHTNGSEPNTKPKKVA